MSKRIDYNNDNNIAAADRATIVPNQAPNTAPAAAKSSKMTAGAKVLAIVLIVLAVCAIALLVINLVINSYVSKINTPGGYENEEIIIAPEITDEQVAKAEELKPEGYDEICKDVLINYAEASHAMMSDENVYNFGIYGINKFADSKEKGVASFVAVASFNKNTKKVTYAVFKEEVLTYIPMNVGMGGLKDAYEWGGSALLTKTIKYNFGIDINGYIELDMTSAAKLIDNAGNLKLTDLKDAEVHAAIDSFNAKFKTNIDKPAISNGKAELTGMQAIAYLRADKANSNTIIKVLGDSIFGSGLGGIKESANIVLEGTKTSIKKDDFVAVAKMAMSMLKKADSTVITVGEKTLDKLSFNLANNRIVYCDMAAERELLANTLYGTEQK